MFVTVGKILMPCSTEYYVTGNKNNIIENILGYLLEN